MVCECGCSSIGVVVLCVCNMDSKVGWLGGDNKALLALDSDFGCHWVVVTFG